jgi:hypothetical protein
MMVLLVARRECLSCGRRYEMKEQEQHRSPVGNDNFFDRLELLSGILYSFDA